MTPDSINGAFELIAGLMIFDHCRCLYRDKSVKGVSVVSAGFFSVLGFWNLYYYPSLDQWVSFTAGLLIVTANTLWVSLMIYYGRKESHE